MQPEILFLPQPRRVTFTGQRFSPLDGKLILLETPIPQGLVFTARRIQAAIKKHRNLRWEINASPAVPFEEVGLTLRVNPSEAKQAEGYLLEVHPGGIIITGHDDAGVFYAACTLIQLLQQTENTSLPGMRVEDWPDYPARGVLLDISRDKVPTMETLFTLVDRLAGWKVNQVQLYTEHVFAYRNHPEVWAKASPLTGEEILALDAFCRERHVELVPNQASFGHMKRWLVHPRYAPLAETGGAVDFPWGREEGPFSLNPLHPGSLELVCSLYDELLPHFTSRQVNVNCDETFDLGQGASREAVEQFGRGRVYLDYLLKLHRETRRRGFIMQFWGDIILESPGLVPELPRDSIALLWGYEASHPFGEQAGLFAQAGVPFHVCPGTSSWNSIAGRSDNALGNLRNAAAAGLAHGAAGYLNTDWGDNGHWQTLPVSYLGLGMGAAYSWCLAANQDAGVEEVISRFAFDDMSGVMGKLAFQLGNVYRVGGVEIPNFSPLHGVFLLPLEQVGAFPGVSLEYFDALEAAVDEAAADLGNDAMTGTDAALIRREYQCAAHLMKHACGRGRLAVSPDPLLARHLAEDMGGFLAEYREIWLERNRPGGLEDSTARFEKAIQEYQSP